MRLLLVSIVSLFAASLCVAESPFKTGPQIQAFGENAAVKQSKALSQEARFKVAFDVGDAAEPGKLNRRFNSLARFINMHVAAGVKPANIELALVVHGKAAYDLLHNESRAKKKLAKNPNLALLQALLDNNTQIFLCGQTAAYYSISGEDLYPGVQLSLSAMTAHALLQQDGFTVNPF